MLRPWIGLFAALGVALAIEATASACTPSPCAETTAFVGLARVDADDKEEIAVPIDGVLVMQAQYFGEPAPDARSRLTLTVTLDGDPVDGEVEAFDRVPGLLLWRPAELLVPEATYEVSGSFANLEGVPSECAAQEVEIAFEFTTTAGKSGPFVAPQMWTSSGYVESAVVDFDSLVCCDGAMPFIPQYCGIPERLSWLEGHCASAFSRVRYRVQLGVSSILDKATAAQWTRTLYRNGERLETTFGRGFTLDIAEPACFMMEQVNLATGETLTSEERCFDEQLTSPLGNLPTDPSEELRARCETTPYVCEVDEDGWVDEQCEPWLLTEDPPSESRSCTCKSGRANATPALLGLLLLVRRRRRQSRSRPTTAVLQSPELLK